MAELLEDIIQKQGAFAAQFAGTPTTSLAQRQRRADKIQRARELEGDRAAAREESFLIENKGARDLMFGRERALRDRERSAQSAERIGIERSRLGAQMDRDEFNRQISERRARLGEMTATERMAKDALDMRNAERITSDNAAIYQKLGTIDDPPDSPEFAAKALRYLSEHPFADSGLRQKVFGTIKWGENPEDVQARYEALSPEQKKRTRVTYGDGGMTLSIAPEQDAKPEDESARLDKELATAIENSISLRNAGADPEDIKYYDDKKSELRKRIGELRGAEPTSATEDPRTALARKALNDPNASDAHKAAAKKILGL